MPEVKPIAMGVGAMRYGTVGDGAPASVFTELPLPFKGSVVFNFSDPKEVKIETEGSPDPLYSLFVKDTTDFIEFSIPTPSNDLITILAGGVHDTTTGNDEWQEPTSVPDIKKTFQCETEVHDGKKVIYTIVNGKIMAKLSQAPGSDKPELLLVRVYKQAAITAAGVRKYAFSRKVLAVV